MISGIAIYCNPFFMYNNSFFHLNLLETCSGFVLLLFWSSPLINELDQKESRSSPEGVQKEVRRKCFCVVLKSFSNPQEQQLYLHLIKVSLWFTFLLCKKEISEICLTR